MSRLPLDLKPGDRVVATDGGLLTVHAAQQAHAQHAPVLLVVHFTDGSQVVITDLRTPVQVA